jgi:putative addiction module component (TIGR02574 family)
MLDETDASRTAARTPLNQAFSAAEALTPDDRLRLIARLWASLPQEHWAAPTPFELHDLERRLRDYDDGRLADVPWEIVRAIVTNRPAPHRPARVSKLYSAPRRFDLATIFAVTAAYSILLGGMSALRFPPEVSCYVAAFITLVGIGQAVLFRSSMPRLASVLTGMVAYFLCTISFALVEPRFDLFGFMPAAIVFSIVFGGLLGYLAGVLVGGVFLVADVLRQRYGRPTDADDAPAAFTSHADSHAPAQSHEEVATTSQS